MFICLLKKQINFSYKLKEDIISQLQSLSQNSKISIVNYLLNKELKLLTKLKDQKQVLKLFLKPIKKLSISKKMLQKFPFKSKKKPKKLIFLLLKLERKVKSQLKKKPKLKFLKKKLIKLLPMPYRHKKMPIKNQLKLYLLQPLLKPLLMVFNQKIFLI